MCMWSSESPSSCWSAEGHFNLATSATYSYACVVCGACGDCERLGGPDHACVCVCVWEREREKQCVSVYVCVSVAILYVQWYETIWQVSAVLCREGRIDLGCFIELKFSLQSETRGREKGQEHFQELNVLLTTALYMADAVKLCFHKVLWNYSVV